MKKNDQSISIQMLHQRKQNTITLFKKLSVSRKSLTIIWWNTYVKYEAVKKAVLINLDNISWWTNKIN